MGGSGLCGFGFLKFSAMGIRVPGFVDLDAWAKRSDRTIHELVEKGHGHEERSITPPKIV